MRLDPKYETIINALTKEYKHTNYYSDLRQECLITLWKCNTKYTEGKIRNSFDTYLTRALKQTIWKYVEKERKQPMCTDNIDGVYEVDFDFNFDRQVLEEKILDLSGDERDVLYLFIKTDLTQKQIAKKLDIPIDRVKYIIRRFKRDNKA